MMTSWLRVRSSLKISLATIRGYTESAGHTSSILRCMILRPARNLAHWQCSTTRAIPQASRWHSHVSCSPIFSKETLLALPWPQLACQSQSGSCSSVVYRDYSRKTVEQKKVLEWCLYWERSAVLLKAQSDYSLETLTA